MFLSYVGRDLDAFTHSRELDGGNNRTRAGRRWCEAAVVSSIGLVVACLIGPGLSGQPRRHPSVRPSVYYVDADGDGYGGGKPIYVWRGQPSQRLG